MQVLFSTGTSPGTCAGTWAGKCEGTSTGTCAGNAVSSYVVYKTRGCFQSEGKIN